MSKGNRERRRELGLLPSPTKCAARSSRTGEPCKNAPINGAAVCRWHGGAASQVVKKAKERIALAADDAVSVLIRLMQDEGLSASDRRQAATSILDRAGITSKAELALTVDMQFEDLLLGVVTEVPEGTEMSRDHKYGARQPQGEVVAGEVVEESEPKPPRT